MSHGGSFNGEDFLDYKEALRISYEYEASWSWDSEGDHNVVNGIHHFRVIGEIVVSISKVTLADNDEDVTDICNLEAAAKIVRKELMDTLEIPD